MNTVSDGQVHIVDNETTRTNEDLSKWASEPVRNVEGEATTAEETKNSFSQWGSLPMGNITTSSSVTNGKLIYVFFNTCGLGNKKIDIRSIRKQSWCGGRGRPILERVMV